MKTMKIHVIRRSGKFMGDMDVNEDITFEAFKEEFSKKFHYYPERQRFTINTAQGRVLTDTKLTTQGVEDGTTLCFKDLGVQISWRLVFVLEYLGPLIIMPFLYFCPHFFYDIDPSLTIIRSKTQKMAFLLFMIHFIKRETETLFIHRFSNATMPAVRLLINCSHYWILCAFSIGYYLCHPKYQAPYGDSTFVIYLFSTAFLVFEAFNLCTHLVLRQLRSRGTKERGIPHGFGFQWVSCANYLWESLAWITFSFMIMCFTSFIFTIAAVVQMLLWALKKHKNYKKIPYYPRTRKAMIPFII